MSGDRRSLEEERDFLLRSIADLDAERDAGDLSDEEYSVLLDDYTVRAAAVIARLDGDANAATAREREPRVRTVGRARPVRRRGRAIALAVAVTVVAGATGLTVARSSGERLPSDAATGSLVEGNSGRLARAQALVGEGEVLDAIKLYDEVLRDDPENPVALAQRGWVISRVDPSLVDKGLESIERALAVDPSYAEAHFFRGMILLQAKGRPADAAAAFQAALDSKPPRNLVSFLEDARRRALDAAAQGQPPG